MDKAIQRYESLSFIQDCSLVSDRGFIPFFDERADLNVVNYSGQLLNITLQVNTKCETTPHMYGHEKGITRREIKHNLDINVSLITITKRLKEAKLFCRVARKKAFLSAGHKVRRLQFANSYRDFSEWKRTIFVDESIFQSGRPYRALVRRPIGTAFHEEYIQKTAYSGRRSVSLD